MLSILAQNIHDNRFLRLIKQLLQAGYLEEWRYHRTQSGTPQGGVISPLLANIYLDQLDHYVETTLCPLYSRGIQRRHNPVYARLKAQAKREREKGQYQQAKVRHPPDAAIPRWRSERSHLPATDLRSLCR